ncbi:glycosyltransferase family 2 protein [Haloarchaeobius sp. HME9146]|uniref:glycosyltransferase family 2 protein n=1 Tax=Haloarchaeobius sp. HME9146 TaxID=2978732 RepID=UPI0021BEF3C2|nr:glycosyltransferase family 2 protein [Haloarchaeobius sp. HME9146]MCT9095682.1 glycosyltransferase [Haloarchaeobius sp. HME9146]
MPKVSVIIPTYNRADTVRRAIDSVLAQTMSDLECLVVDDASTDDTQAVLDEYDDSRLRTFRHDTNRGGNAARNTGLANADGEYVALLDSDDEWKPEKLERQLDRLDAESDDWVAAYCDWEYDLDESGESWKRTVAALLDRFDRDYPTEGGADDMVREILADNLHTGAGSTLLVETAVARDVGGFDEDLDRFQDTEFALRVVKAGKLAHVAEPLMIRHDTGSPSAETYRDANEELLSKYDEEVAAIEADGRDIRGQRNLFVAKHFLAEGRPVGSLRHLRRASVDGHEVPGVLASAARGLNRRKRSVAIALTLVLAVTLGYTLTRGTDSA